MFVNTGFGSSYLRILHPEEIKIPVKATLFLIWKISNTYIIEIPSVCLEKKEEPNVLSEL